jgi:hypothetical protein
MILSKTYDTEIAVSSAMNSAGGSSVHQAGNFSEATGVRLIA